jgi:drug/metabolite transporter (DMT)-like permease
LRSWFLLGCVATVLSGCWGFCIKLALTGGVDFSLVTVISSVMAFVVPLLAAWRRHRLGAGAGSPSPPGLRSSLWLALLSGVLAGGGQIGYFGALSEGPASIVAPLSGLYPVVTIMLSVVLLKEQPAKMEVAGIVLALLAPILMLM